MKNTGSYLLPGICGLCLSGLVACGGGGGGNASNDNDAEPLLFDDFQPAVSVIGQADFGGFMRNQGATANANTLDLPFGEAARGSLYLADRFNHRILGFNSIPDSSNPGADFVLGQPDFVSSLQNNGGLSATSLASPLAAVVSNGKLFVSDFGNSRVLIWNALPTSSLVPADVVLGAPDFTTSGSGLATQSSMIPTGLEVAGGRIFVVDNANHRVLIWNSIPTVNNTPADLVLGQSDFTGDNPATTDSRMRFPTGVWSDGQRLVIADQLNHRILIWESIPTTNGAAADYVLGQPDFTSNSSGGGSQGMNQPVAVHSSHSRLFVSDSLNNRILIFNQFPTSNHAVADRVLGQSSFSNTAANDIDQDGISDAQASASTLNGPGGTIAIDNQLLVTDHQNSRILIFEGQ